MDTTDKGMQFKNEIEKRWRTNHAGFVSQHFDAHSVEILRRMYYFATADTLSDVIGIFKRFVGAEPSFDEETVERIFKHIASLQAAASTEVAIGLAAMRARNRTPSKSPRRSHLKPRR